MNFKSLDVLRVGTIEDYLFHMGVFAVSLQSLQRLQKVAEDKGLFSEDEIENARNIDYMIHRLSVGMDDQIRMVSSRSPLGWDEILSQIVEVSKKMTNPMANDGEKIKNEKTRKIVKSRRKKAD